MHRTCRYFGQGWIVCNDGCIVYANGNEVFRYNLPSSTVTFSTAALANTDSLATFTNRIAFSIPDVYIVNGVNLIAVEVRGNGARARAH